MGFKKKIVWVAVFAAAFALVEAAVVDYLRALYYPEGFSLPLKLINEHHIVVETAREAATLIMLSAVAILAGQSRWERFAFFIIAFGVWDICYYVWLKVFLNWPNSVFELDVLFLLPIPWLGPVYAPVLISACMILAGLLIMRTESIEGFFRPGKWSWLLSIAGTALVLFSFVRDFEATVKLDLPRPFRHDLFFGGIVLYAAAMWFAFVKKS